MANSNKTKVITGKNTRLSYFHGWEPVSIDGSPERYSVSVLIPKDDTETVNAINNAVNTAIEEGIGKFGGKSQTKHHLNFLFVTVIPSVMMRLMQVTGLSMQTAEPLRRLLIRL